MTVPYLEWIETESDAFAKTITGENFDRPVPGCPEWTLWDLVGHLGNVQAFWASTIRLGGEIPPDPANLETRDSSDVRTWFMSRSRELRDALRETSWDDKAWTWWGEPSTVGAIARHQAQEAAVHRWDAQSATRTPDVLPRDLAADALDEFVAIVRQMGEPKPVSFVVCDTQQTVDAGPNPVVRVTGTASDLLLFCYGRDPAEPVAVDGDRSALDDYLFEVG